MTSPANTPVKEPADVADVAAPISVAVMVPALKLPPASRMTSVETVLALVAALARFAPAATLAAVTAPTVATTVALWEPVMSPVKVPVNAPADVAVAALPVMLPTRFAVIVPAEKLPVASRLTRVAAVAALTPALAKIEIGRASCRERVCHCV